MTDQEDIERRVDFLVRELDELIVLSADPATRALINNEIIGIGQVQTRAALIVTYFRASPELRNSLNAQATLKRNHGFHGAA